MSDKMKWLSNFPGKTKMYQLLEGEESNSTAQEFLPRLCKFQSSAFIRALKSSEIGSHLLIPTMSSKQISSQLNKPAVEQTSNSFCSPANW